MRRVLVLSKVHLALCCAMPVITGCADRIQSGDISIDDGLVAPWRGGNNQTHAYMTIEVTGGVPDRLLAASSPVASDVKLVTSWMLFDVVMNSPVDSIEIAPGKPTVLDRKLGGQSIQFLGLTEKLEEGEGIPITFTFQNAGQISLELPVRNPDGLPFNGPFTLTDHQGRQVTEATYDGRYMLVYFGYTFCPDTCSRALRKMMDAYDEISVDLREKITPIFVTLDPVRDTVDVMATYVARFHPDLIGLTGSDAEIDAVAAMYQVDHAKIEDAEGSDNYLIDHNSRYFVLAPDNKARSMAPITYSSKDLVEHIASVEWMVTSMGKPGPNKESLPTSPWKAILVPPPPR